MSLINTNIISTNTAKFPPTLMQLFIVGVMILCFGACCNASYAATVKARSAANPQSETTTVYGYVTYTTGAPVHGAVVTLATHTYTSNSPGEYTPLTPPSTTTTGAGGYFSFTVEKKCSVAHDFVARSLELIDGQPLQPRTGSMSGCILNESRIDLPIYIPTSSIKDNQNGGPSSCKESVGEPVNVTNGNMYLQQTDYRLPGIGLSIDITRTYNSGLNDTNLFGRGWSTPYDVFIRYVDSRRILLNLPNGRAVYFTRATTTELFTPETQYDVRGQIAQTAGGFTLTMKDGGVYEFNPAGKLSSMADRHDNRTTLAYGANGMLASLTDSSGRALNVTTNASGRVSSMSDALGIVATYTYGTGHELLSVTYPDNSQFKFEYVAVGNKYLLTSVKDALDNVLEAHTYDSQGRALTSERHGGVERYTLAYLAGETHVTDALGHLTKYFLDKSRSRYAVTRIEGSCNCGGSRSETWGYDAQLNTTSRTNALNQTTTFTHDATGNRLTETGALGTTTYTYNGFGQVLTIIDPMNGETRNEYNARGRLISTRDATGGLTSFAYDARGQLQSVTDPRRNVVMQFTYDANGNVTEQTDALSNATTFAYDGRGRVTSKTDALSNSTALTYDAVGRLKTVTQPDNSVVTYTYDPAGRRTKVRDARGYETVYEYDGAYRLTRETDAANNSTSYAYDLASNLTGATDALGRTTNYVYDDFDRLTKITYPEASAGAGRLEERFAYDAAGNLTQKTDQAGRTSSYVYDTSNRLTKTVDALLKETQYEYNARSQTVAVIDALGQRYEFVSDALGRTTQIRRGGLAMSFIYDASGNRTRRTDYSGAATNYTYDTANRLTAINYPNGTSATYAHDQLSRLTGATNEHGTITTSYNNVGRVSSVTDVWGQAVGYSYDASGNRTQLRLGATVNANYQYDALNRLTQLADGAGAAFTYAYDQTGKLTARTSPNGVASTYSYDRLDRLTRLKHAKGIGTVADYQQQFNPVGQITQITEPTGARNFAYDAVDRLTAATRPNLPSESYTYDGVGNRTASHQSSNYQYQPFNKVITIGSTSYAYDSNGNLTSKSDAAGLWQYTWDYENRLTRVTRPDGLQVSYKYDALGRRIERSKGGGWTRFSYDGSDVVLDRLSNGSTVEYLNGIGVDEKLRLKTSAGATLYFTQDHLGSTRALTDTSGNVVERWEYDTFGNGYVVLPGGGLRPETVIWAREEEGEEVAQDASLTRYRYTGRERDGDTGLYYYRARWYDSQSGRFLSEDPIGFAGGDVNLYGYVWNSPLGFTDPTGLDGWGNDTAAWLERRIEYARGFYQSDVQDWVWNGSVDTVADLSSGAADMLRVGSGTGHAIYDEDDNGYGRGANVAMDIARASGLFTLLGAPGARFANSPRGCALNQRVVRFTGKEYPSGGKTFRVAPLGNRTNPPHPTGRFPHYHRQGPKFTKGKKRGQSMPGQSMKRHRPWDNSPFDNSFLDRF